MKVLRGVVIAFFIITVVLFVGTEHMEAQKVDRTIPVIESEAEEIQVKCDATDEDLLQGLLAYDEKDGNLTSELMVDSISNFIEKGTVNVQYVIFDQDCNYTNYTRKVVFTDYESPKFQLSHPLIFSNNEDVNLMNYLMATDSIEGNISNRIQISYGSDSTSDVTKLTVSVSNSYGDTASIPIEVEFEEKQGIAPTIELTDYLVYIKKGKKFNPMDYFLEAASYNGISLKKKKVKTVSTVNTKKAGCYQVEYFISDEFGQGRTKLLVVVEE